MGGGSSTQTRNITLQDEGNGVVKVSEDVAKRLMGRTVIPSTDAKQDTRQPMSSQDREEEIEKLQAFYEKRIDALDKKNKELYQTTTEQFAQAVEEVEQKFLKTTASPVCRDLQDAVLQCYQDNPKYTLHCSAQVKAFTECVQQQREKILTRKG